MSTAPAPCDDTPRQVLPHNAEAEKTVLGAILVEPKALDSCRLEPHDFFREPHVAIYSAIRQLVARSAHVDLVTVKEELFRAGQLEAAGGPAYLGSLVDGVPRVTSIQQWAAIIRAHSQRREIIRVAQRLASAAYESEIEPQELIERADVRLLKISARGSESRGPRDNKAIVDKALDNIALRMEAPLGIIGYRTGLEDLDAILQGIRPGRMGVIGARLGNGKSMLAMNLADAIAEQEPSKAVAFFSLEMDDVEFAERRLAAESRVNPNALWSYSKEKRHERWGRLATAATKLYVSNVRVIEDAWTVPEIAQECRELRNKEGLAAVFVDYVQLMRGERGRAEKRYLEVAEISVNLRKLAKDLDVPLVAIAQLSREADARGDAKKHRAPVMSDLAESDNLGRDAHWCILIDPEPPPLRENAGVAYLYVRKNRGGKKGECRAKYRPNYSRFLDLDPAAPETQEAGA